MQVDGVFSGGGIRGLAFVGAYEALEQRGIKFIRIGGTSAGAIIAAFIMAGYSSSEIKDMMEETDFRKLLDERKLWLPIPFAKWLLLYKRMGLYKGDALENWIESKLAQKGIHSFSDWPPQAFRVIASDLSNAKLMVLPDDLQHYGIDPRAFSVAKAVRMSCSIPYFFEPVKLKIGKKKNLIVDGGVLSNFPMWLFDSENVKKVRPVLGLKISSDQYLGEPKEIGNAFELFGGLFETMKDAHDSRYISRKLTPNILFIPSKGAGATEFHLTEEKKRELIEWGRTYTEAFLKRWSY
ncbi:NTE family protein [Peribacillus deserti]|uniref:NTE family protein n=1 Tax=Peribacillus deserti TaxID=673318 RepID=A0ABS2QJD1_9BACI|nr:patatin-like phospholipase family protein [Peribacillus deserti]MBM7693271.1 NTE family protein [Peribacillus deserti]